MTQEELKNSEIQGMTESNTPSSAENAAETSFFETLFSFSGRNRRSRYVMTMLLVCFLVVLIEMLVVAGGEAMAVLGVILMIPLIWISIANAVKRCHDLGKSGAFFLLSFIPIINIIVGLYLLFTKGDLNANEYGPSPYDDTVA